MDLSSLSSLTGGGGLDAGSQAGGNDQLTGGANITFGYLPPLPTLPTLPTFSNTVGSSFTSNSGGGMGGNGWLMIVAILCLVMFLLIKSRG